MKEQIRQVLGQILDIAKYNYQPSVDGWYKLCTVANIALV